MSSNELQINIVSCLHVITHTLVFHTHPQCSTDVPRTFHSCPSTSNCSLHTLHSLLYTRCSVSSHFSLFCTCSTHIQQCFTHVPQSCTDTQLRSIHVIQCSTRVSQCSTHISICSAHIPHTVNSVPHMFHSLPLILNHQWRSVRF